MNASDSEKEDAEIEATETAPDEENAKLKKKEKKKKKKASSKDAEKKRGVCYMSRIPPHMDHVKLRHILSQFGDIQRIFLAPNKQIQSLTLIGHELQIFHALKSHEVLPLQPKI